MHERASGGLLKRLTPVLLAVALLALSGAARASSGHVARWVTHGNALKLAPSHGPKPKPLGWMTHVPAIDFDKASEDAGTLLVNLLFGPPLQRYFAATPNASGGTDTRIYDENVESTCTLKRCQFTTDIYDGDDSTGRFVGRIRITERLNHFDELVHHFGWLSGPVAPPT